MAPLTKSLRGLNAGFPIFPFDLYASDITKQTISENNYTEIPKTDQSTKHDDDDRFFLVARHVIFDDNDDSHHDTKSSRDETY